MSDTGTDEVTPPNGGGSDAAGRTFGGLTPSEAGRLRWQRQREREAAEKAAGGTDEDDARFVRVPVRVGKIISALEKESVAGKSQAARELRSWLEQYPPEDAAFDPADLSREQRRRLYARLLAEDDASQALVVAESAA